MTTRKTTIISVITVVLIALATMTTIRFRTYRADAQRGGCWCVLACIETAKEHIEIADKLKPGDPAPVARVAEYIKHGTNHFICPTVGSNTYTIGNIGESPRCSFHGSLQELRDHIRAKNKRQ